MPRLILGQVINCINYTAFIIYLTCICANFWLIDGCFDGLSKCYSSGTNVTEAFDAQRQFEPQGPFVNSEYYTGWLDHWGTRHEHVTVASVKRTLDDMLAINASVNM